MLKMKLATPEILSCFPTTSEPFPLNDIIWRHFLVHNSINDTLNIIKNYDNNDDQFTRKAAMPQDKFLDLDNLDFKTTCYTFNINKLITCDGRTKIFNPSRNLYTDSWINCTIYGTTPCKRMKLQNTFGKQITTLPGIRRKLLMGRAG